MFNLYMRFPGGLKKCVTLSYDDGVVQDERLIGIMKKYGLRGTFNLNSGAWADQEYTDGKTAHRRLTHDRALKLYKESGFEVAVHGYDHPWLEQLPINVATRELLKDRRALENDFGTIIRGSAYPFGTYNNDVVKALECCGIVYSRTVHSTYNFELPDNWLILNPTCHHGDPKLPELTDRFLNGPIWSKPYFFYLWGHSYEFDWNDQWDIIETFGSKVGNRDDIWYATNIEAYDYVHAFKQLIFDVDMTRCYNPTALTLWFEDGNKSYEIAPGATLML